MKHAITLRIDNDLLVAARRRAQAENRTLTNFVETVLKSHIAKASIGPDCKSAKGGIVKRARTVAPTKPATVRVITRKAIDG